MEARPLERVTLLDSLAGGIEEQILSGTIHAGTRLPSESVLAARFGVSRPVVREALARLRERGLAETVNGSGTYVRAPDAGHLARTLLRHLQFAVAGAGGITNLFEARVCVEETGARLAALRATAEDVRSMETAIQAMKLFRSDPQRYADADLDFHLAVAASSHNPFFTTFLGPLVEVIRGGIAGVHRQSDAVRLGIRAHEEILERIRAGDGDGCARAMGLHLAESERYVIEMASVGRDEK
jgi:DNA-binding FadR family transcriptional regulator